MTASPDDPNHRPAHPASTLTRDDIVDGLRELIRSLHADDRSALMQIVGGAAIALTLDAERRATRDVDGPLVPADVIVATAESIARARNWPLDWVNDSAAQFVPNGFGRAAEWTTIYDEDGVRIQIATPEMLLAMKLYAAEKRHLREAEDLAVLLHATGIETVDEAERLYGEFYPGDAFSARLLELVSAILAAPYAPKPRPNVPDLAG